MKKQFGLSRKKQSSLKVIPLLLTAFVAFVACESDDSIDSNNNYGNATPVSVSFTTRSGAQRPAGNDLLLLEAKVLVSQMEFENDMEDDGFAEDSLEFETDPFVVELSTTGNTTVQSTLPIGGVYDEIEVDIEALDEDDPVVDPVFVDGNDRYSIVATGEYNGVVFTFRSDIEIELEMELDPPLTVETNNATNIEIVVDVSQWFVDANGNPLDPTLISNHALIESNIKSSFHASEDDHGDEGDDDEGEG